MIYTLSFNPAIDYYLKPDRFVLNEINRCKSAFAYPGGKGINVSRMLNGLGTDTVALGFIAGFTGDVLQKALSDLSIKTDFITLKDGLTRINVKIRCEAETDINCDGPNIDKESLKELYSKLDKLKSGDTLVLAGSLPKSIPQDTYENILEHIKGRNITAVVDTAGKKMLGVLKHRPFLIKPNNTELGEMFDTTADSPDEILPLALKLQDLGARNVLVSRGADGAVLLTENGEIINAPDFNGTAVNTVGAGDAMLAGFLHSFNENGDMQKALTLGAAAGAATAFSNDLATPELIYRLLESKENL